MVNLVQLPFGFIVLVTDGRLFPLCITAPLSDCSIKTNVTLTGCFTGSVGCVGSVGSVGSVGCVGSLLSTVHFAVIVILFSFVKFPVVIFKPYGFVDVSIGENVTSSLLTAEVILVPSK